MDWITGIQRAVDYAEENMTGEIVYEEAARRALSSSFHFQRVFSAVCGYTLGEYIRRRRLSLAGSELACTGAKGHRHGVIPIVSAIFQSTVLLKVTQITHSDRMIMLAVQNLWHRKIHRCCNKLLGIFRCCLRKTRRLAQRIR